MTLREVIFEQTGYECKTTFPEDFAIAELFGEDAIRDTFNRSFEEWQNDVVYLTELVLVLNWKIWQWYENDDELSMLYNELWEEADNYGCENFKGEDAQYFYSTLD